MTSVSFYPGGSAGWCSPLIVGTISGVPEQYFLSNCRHVSTGQVEHVTDRQSPTADEAVAREIVQVPGVGADGSVEPDRVVEAGGEEHSVAHLFGLGADGMRPDHGVGREVVGQV